MKLTALRPNLLSCRLLPQADRALLTSLGGDPARHTSLAFVTCDQDDSLYAALDHATKFAKVDVIYARSLYAGSAHASGPFSGEILGVLAGPDPDEVAEGLHALRQALAEDICFYTPTGAAAAPAFFPHVIPRLGTYLAEQAGLRPGDAMAYLIAPPTEALVGLDAALKVSGARLQKFFGPPTETNFAGAYLHGDQPAVEAAARAFTEAVLDVVTRPLQDAVRPDRERR